MEREATVAIRKQPQLSQFNSIDLLLRMMVKTAWIFLFSLLYALNYVQAFRFNQKSRLVRDCQGVIQQGRLFARSKSTIVNDNAVPVIPIEENSALDGLLIANSIELTSEMKDSFLAYAMSTILGRALPDVRDGLKPVHRRVLYAMYALGLSSDSSYRKCARIVGEVLGKFHPHGDNSVYDALVRMAQDFVMMYPLINGHGNFGSVDGDPAAAMRYTEARLSPLATDSLLTDIKEDTVDFSPNFDGNEQEPLFLPARLPLLLINGASGIAVGMATNIPPHNLNEVIDALLALIQNPEITDSELMNIVPAPDFPTGGQIVSLKGARAFYSTGQGSIPIRAKSTFETISTKGGAKNKNAIVITELPYMTNKATLLEKMAFLVNDKKLEGISDLRDESDRDGMRIVIELKRDANPNIVLNNLYKKTELLTSFPGNFVALVDDGKQPQRLNLKSCLEKFLTFRFTTVRRHAQFLLQKLTDRQHIVLGLILALSKIDEIITVMKNSKDINTAKTALLSEEKFGFTEIQAEAVLSLTLRRLTGLEEQKLQTEHTDLLRQITDQTKIIENDAAVYEMICSESKELKAKFGRPRQTEIIPDTSDNDNTSTIRDEDLIVNERVVILLTGSGYIKRLSLDEFESQSRGGRGRASAKLSTDDTISQFFTCMTHDSVLFLTDRGVAHNVRAFHIPVSSRTAKGSPLPHVITLHPNEKVTSVIPIDSFKSEKESLIMLTQQGWLKKTALSAFEITSKSRGLTAIALDNADALQWTRRCHPQEEIFLSTRQGFVSRFSVDDLRETGRTSRGVISMRKLRVNDSMADMDILSPAQLTVNSTLLVVTEQGYGKRVLISEFDAKARGSMGVIAIKFKKGKTKVADRLIGVRVCHSLFDEVVLSTAKGTVIRQRIGDIAMQSRIATGVLLQNLDNDDRIVQLDIVPAAVVDAAPANGDTVHDSAMAMAMARKR